MPTATLSTQLVNSAVCPEGRSKLDLYDTAVPGFILEVRPSGGKTYHLRYSDQRGRLRQIKIGGYHDITFDQARKKAKQLRSEVTLGGDPAAKKEVLKAIPTYANLAEQHIAHAKAQLAQRVGAAIAPDILQGLFQRKRDTLHHGVEEIGLVLEVPVHRASGHAGRLRHVLQRGPRDALECKQVLGRINQCGAGLLCIFFGSAHGVTSESV